MSRICALIPVDMYFQARMSDESQLAAHPRL